MKALDLFCGAGGMALGAKLAGISVIESIDSDKHAIETYAHNFQQTNIICDKIENYACTNIGFKPDLIFGGPPCQGYSTSNQRTRSKNNPANWLFTEFFRVVRATMPAWVVMENVKGLVETEDKLFLRSIMKNFKDTGYVANYYILNASDAGVPQRRSRLFFIANKHNKEFEGFESMKCNQVTVHDAISDLPQLNNGANVDCLPYSRPAASEYARMLRGEKKTCCNNIVTKNAPHVIERFSHIPQGGNWKNIPDILMNTYKDKSRCHTGIYRRLEDSSPSVVIGNFRKNMLIHPREDRGLSVREAARLQSFPDWFEFKGSIGFQQQQVGNAVPPLLAKYVFETIIATATTE